MWQVLAYSVAVWIIVGAIIILVKVFVSSTNKLVRAGCILGVIVLIIGNLLLMGHLVMPVCYFNWHIFQIICPV